MPKAAPLQSDFTGGEVSPYAFGRVDQPWYKKSLATCLNGIPMIQGGWTRRPGTKYIASLGAGPLRLIPFAPKFGSNCMMVMSTSTLTFYQNYVSVGSINFAAYSGTITSQELPQVRYVQNGSTMYFFHTNHAPWYVTDTAGNGYPNSAGTLLFYDGPYGNSNVDANGFNVTPVTLTLSTATVGAATITASSVVGINGGSGFLATDVNRFIRLNPTYTAPGTGTWAWFQVNVVNSTTSVTGTLFNSPGATTATTAWTLGLYTKQAGHQPSCGVLYQGRLWLGGATAYPRRFDASSLEYDISLDTINVHFNPTQYVNGLVTDSSGLDFNLMSKDSQNTVWMEGDERGILMGTTGDEWTIRPNTLSGAITPTDVDAKSTTFFGSAPYIAPCKAGKSILFVQRSTLKLREMFYAFDVGGYRSPDRTLWAEHITGTAGIIEMAYQKEPQAIVWAARSDGTMCALTHEEINGEIIAGWHRHTLGVNALVGAQAEAKVISVSTLPSFDTIKDEIWLLTKRAFANPGVESYYLEIIQPVSNQYITDANQWYLDFATQVTNGSPSATISGLSLYEGLVVTVWADGAPYGQFTVSGGTITLPTAVTTALVGFDYNSDGQLLRLEAGSADGTALGKIRRTHRVGLVLQQTLSMQIGMSFSDLTPLTFRTQDTPPSVAQPSFSGIRVETLDADYDTENQFCWRANGGAPCTVLAICPRMDTQDAE